MADLEELERRKRELELQQEIRKLEASERLAENANQAANTVAKVGGWGWGATSASTVAGLLFLILADGTTISYIIGAFLLLPIVFKVFRGAFK